MAKTTKDLKDTTAKLKSTEETLATTTTERDQALATAATEKRRGDKLTDDLAKVRKELGDAQADLAAYKGTDLKPEEIVAIKKQFKGLQDSLQGAKDENKLLGLKIRTLENRLAIYETPDKPVLLPASLKGKVLVTDPKWNFVIINVGQDQEVLEQGELLVNRDGKLVAKVKVNTVQKDRCIANVMPGWQLGEVMENDLVIPAHPRP